MCDPSLKLLDTRNLGFGGIGLIIRSIVSVIRELTTTLMTAIPSSPIIFSKSTYAVESLLTCSTARLKYVPFELDLVIRDAAGSWKLAYLKILPHSLPLAILIVTCRKTALVLLSSTLIISSDFNMTSGRTCKPCYRSSCLVGIELRRNGTRPKTPEVPKYPLSRSTNHQLLLNS
jgi:hypothetical protein